ncbi:phosphate/phosphite/phosphonate ABC transporter substrate-binding protein [Microbacterium sp. ASV81]|uniref:Phosphate/phosphite/phosphonate ABC transporter substrate-binding protein n=1 Tax=Microbacterium capsulatum TaxID=3041921 RepID=A0ABU0XG60_9MICO|nr:phosphate/phosphite/phosphonate ABC transporter substrate-binding protein [Microbacterium sp. ASV81]MDQ4214112.1 phosphate/phosphite/phosphonate ABC transporter substrate-binding protein [Microbacterium sp. ASV81]
MRILNTRRLLGVAALVAAASIALSACSSADGSTPTASASAAGTFAKSADTLVFAATPDQAGSDQNYKPIEDYIAKQTGLKVEYFPTSDYTALIAAMVAGKADITTSGGLQYVMATNKGADYSPVAAQLNSPNVTKAGYYSEAMANPKSGVTSVAGFKGKKVCFVDPNSTSGFLFGLYQLQKAGLDVKSTGTDANGNPQFKDFTAVFAGAHDKSEQAVAAGQCDAGFAEDTIAEAGSQKGEVKVVGKELVVGGPFTVSNKLPSDVKDKLTKALQDASLATVKGSGVTLSDGFAKNYFGVEKIDKAYYQPLFDLCKNIAAAKCAA